MQTLISQTHFGHRPAHGDRITKRAMTVRDFLLCAILYCSFLITSITKRRFLQQQVLQFRVFLRMCASDRGGSAEFKDWD